jgi:hypothetical protein
MKRSRDQADDARHAHSLKMKAVKRLTHETRKSDRELAAWDAEMAAQKLGQVADENAHIARINAGWPHVAVGVAPAGDADYDPDPDAGTPDETEYDVGDDCGRWSNGKLTRWCSQAGTEFCDFECPYRKAT